MIRVEIEGHDPIEFPDNTEQSVIDMVVKRDILKIQQPTRKFSKDEQEAIETARVKPEKQWMEEEMKGLETPWVDPVTAAAGGFGGVIPSGIRAGMGLVPLLTKGAVSAGAGLLTEPFIGQATEEVAGKYPALAFPFALVTGALSGATIEAKITNALTRAKIPATPKIIGEIASEVKTNAKTVEDIPAEIMRRIQARLHPERFRHEGEGFVRVGEPYTKVNVPPTLPPYEQPKLLTTEFKGKGGYTPEPTVLPAKKMMGVPFEQEKLKVAIETPPFLRTAEQRAHLKFLNQSGFFSPPTKQDLSDLKVRVKDTPQYKAVKGAFEEILSPYTVLGKTPEGQKIWDLSYQADKAKSSFLTNLATEKKASLNITPNSESSYKIGQLLDQYEDLSRVPDNVIETLTDAEKQAFSFYRKKWNEFGDTLVETGHLPTSRRLKSYFFRIFDKETIYNAWKNERDALESLVESGKGKAIDKARLTKLRNTIDVYEKKGTMLWDVVPKELTAPFLKERTGGKGYSWDVVKAFDTYSYYYARKIFDEPAVKQGLELMKTLPYQDKEYARWYLRNFLGMERSRLDNIARTITGFEYLSKLGFNPRSAIVNLSQNINTVVEIGPRWSTIGLQKAFTKEGDDIWKASGHAADVPGLYYGMMGKGMQKFKDTAMYLFNNVELANRKIAYLGAYEKALHEGKSIEQAVKYADDVVRKTQFLYGRVGMPRLMTRPAGKIVGQFGTFTIKQVELFSKWMKENPTKMVTYLLATYGVDEAAQKYLGMDFSNALGVGLDYKEGLKALISLSGGDIEKAKYHGKLTWKPGAGIFPSFKPPAYSDLKALLQGEYEKMLPVQLKRTMELGQALEEGEITTKKGQKGYPVRQVGDETLEEVYSPTELAKRTFIGRTTKEKEAFKEGQEQYHAEKLRQQKVDEIIDLRLQGKFMEARQMMNKYHIRITPQLLKAERMRRSMTSSERREHRLKHSPTKKRFMKYINE